MTKKIMIFVAMLTVAMGCFAAGTQRVSATKDRRCNRIVIVNESSETVRIAQADGSNVTGYIKSGQQSSINANSIVLEIGSNCNGHTQISGRDFVITITGGSSSSYSSGSSRSSSGNSRSSSKCTSCLGTGKCKRCNGKGEYYNDGHYGPKKSQLDRYVKCDWCKGTGKCSYCSGRGTR